MQKPDAMRRTRKFRIGGEDDRLRMGRRYRTRVALSGRCGGSITRSYRTDSKQAIIGTEPSGSGARGSLAYFG